MMATKMHINRNDTYINNNDNDKDDIRNKNNDDSRKDKKQY